MNFFKRYGVQGEKSIEHSYIREIKTPDGAKYSFIAVDASIEPGPRRPFNFFGYLNEVIVILFSLIKISKALLYTFLIIERFVSPKKIQFNE